MGGINQGLCRGRRKEVAGGIACGQQQYMGDAGHLYIAVPRGNGPGGGKNVRR